MTTAATAPPPSRYSWLDDLVADPAKGFGDLLSGYAPIYPYTRADAPDAARLLFLGLAPEDPARAAVSSGALDWLEDWRRQPLPEKRPLLQNRIRMVVEAFEIVAVLDLADVALALRQSYPKWLDWTGRMVLSSSRDARAAFWSMLARTQRVVANRVTHPDGLAPLWMRLCREAGSGALPERYLDIGLLGLRRLPGAIQRGDTPWIAGIAAWALARDPSEEEFLQVWQPFKGWHPTASPNLRKQVVNVLAQKPFKDAAIEFPAWWTADPDVGAARSAPPARTLEPPSKEERENLLEKIGAGVPFAKLEPFLRKYVERYRLYAERTGDDDCVRSFCNIGGALLRNPPAEERIDCSLFAEELAREALSYRPAHVFAWGLWFKALVVRGALSAALALGWEKVRRFPDDPESRNQLSELLIAMERTGDALQVVNGALDENVVNAVTYAILARLRAHVGDIEGARQAVEHGLSLDSTSNGLLYCNSALDRGDCPELVSTNYAQQQEHLLFRPTGAQAVDSSILAHGELRSLRDCLDHDTAALDELRAILKADPNFAYARLLAARHKLWDAQSQAMPTVAEAFESALADGDRARLEELTETAPRLEALILLARALFGDADAAREITRRLRGVDENTLDPGTRILGLRLRMVIDGVEAGSDPLDVIQSHANDVRQALYDANEALAADDFVLTA